MKKVLLIFIALLFLAFSPAHSQASFLTPDIGFDPVSQDVVLGSPASVDLFISGLGDGIAPSLGAFDVTIGFNPSILSFNSATYGDPVLGDQLDLFGLGFPIKITIPDSGSVELFELSFNTIDELNNFQAPSFTLATLFFDTLSPGTSPLTISNYILSDAEGEPLLADILSGSVNVVPEPSTLLLLASGLAGLGYFRKIISKKS